MDDEASWPSVWPVVLLAVGLFAVGGFIEIAPDLGIAFFESERDLYWPGYVAMTVFYAVIFYIGLYASHVRGAEDSDEVLLAGRSIPLGVAVFTMSATWLGGGFINGTAESAAKSGLIWVQAPWGYALSLMIGGLFFAKKMRRLEFTTVIDPLEQRFGERMAAVLSIPAVLGELFWTATILVALGTTFGTVLGLDFTTAIITSAVIAIAYTAAGGLWAVAFTDVIQLFFLFAGLLIVVPYAVEHVGGLGVAWDQYVAQLQAEGRGWAVNLVPPLDGWKSSIMGNSYWTWWDFALMLAFGGIPWQVYFQRVLSSEDPETARWLSIFAGFVCLAAAVPAALIGITGDVVTWSEVAPTAPESDALVLPYVVRYLTPHWVATLGLGAIAAAVMSSVDSSILSASSMASWNIYRRLINPDIDSETLEDVLQTCIWIIGVAATLIALGAQSVYALWVLCSDLVYCLLFPQLVTSLFDPKANRIGSASGLAVSSILRFGAGIPALGIPQLIPYWMTTYGPDGELSYWHFATDFTVNFPFRTLAMVVGLVTIVVVSRLTQSLDPPQALE